LTQSIIVDIGICPFQNCIPGAMGCTMGGVPREPQKIMCSTTPYRQEWCNYLGTVKRVSHQKLGVSEPDPYRFGNPPNEKGNPYWTNKNWLRSLFHFSFAGYHNGKNSKFGSLLVMNDDLVQPLRGFGTNERRDAEICIYVIEGHLTHRNSKRRSQTLTRGAVQFMTAGRGVRHSEHNENDVKSLRFIQMWFTPHTAGLKPQSGSSDCSEEARKNRWHYIASDIDNTKVSTGVKINTDASIRVTEIDERSSLKLNIKSGRQAYMLCIEGKTCILDEHNGRVCTKQGVSLTHHDAAELVGPLILKVTGPSHLLVVEMAFNAGSHGRGDL